MNRKTLYENPAEVQWAFAKEMMFTIIPKIKIIHSALNAWTTMKENQF